MFLRQAIRNPRATAAVAPSSRFLADRMLEGVDFARLESVVEFGPGTGVFTRAVARRLAQAGNDRCRLIAIELNPDLADALVDSCPRAAVYHDDARRVGRIARAEGVRSIDMVISGLGWPSLPARVRNGILVATARALRPGGEFRTFGYHIGLTLPGAWAFRRAVRTLFESVQITPVEWRNIPPAFVYRCLKGAGGTPRRRGGTARSA